MSKITFPKFGNEFKCYEAEIELMQNVCVHTSLHELVEYYRLKSIKLFKNLEAENQAASHSKINILNPNTNEELILEKLKVQIKTIACNLQQLLANHNDFHGLENIAADMTLMSDKILYLNANANKNGSSEKEISDLNISYVENLLTQERKREIETIANISDELILNSIQYPFNEKWELARITQLEETEKKKSELVTSQTKNFDELLHAETTFALQLDSLDYQIMLYDKAITERMQLYNLKMEEMDYQTTLRKTALNDVKAKMEQVYKIYIEREKWFEWLRQERAAIVIQIWWRLIYQKIKKKSKGKKKIEPESEL